MVMYELPTMKKSERLKAPNQEVSTFSAYSGSCAGCFVCVDLRARLEELK